MLVPAIAVAHSPSHCLRSLSTVVLEPKKRKPVTTSTFSPSTCHAVTGPDATQQRESAISIYICPFHLEPPYFFKEFPKNTTEGGECQIYIQVPRHTGPFSLGTEQDWIRLLWGLGLQRSPERGGSSGLNCVPPNSHTETLASRVSVFRVKG